MEKKFAGFESAQGELNAFVDLYNHQRPHQSLDMATPLSKFDLAAAVRIGTPAHVVALEGICAARRIGEIGVISIAWSPISVGMHRAGQDVDALMAWTMVYIYYKDKLLKITRRSNRRKVRKKRSQL